MDLRFLQIFIPEASGDVVDQCLEDHQILGTWRDDSVEARVVIHLLVAAEETEPLMDRFESAFGGQDGFHIVLFPVEAVLPRPHSEDDSADSNANRNDDSQPELRAGRVSREELYNDITESLGINRVFVAMTLLSSVVATVGLLRDDVAVIIGAMVIAPLLGPNVALSLSTTLGDLELMRKALKTNLAGVFLATAVAVAVGLAVTVDPAIPAIANRTNFRLGDVALALAAGSAGTFAFTRGLSNAVIGVMVAVALMPPLVTFGMLIGDGHWLLAIEALLLLVANVVCIILAGVFTFSVQGVRPRSWWEEERARQSSRIAIAICSVMLIVLIAILSTTRF